MNEQDDSILVRQCLAGDRSGFEVLVRKYVKPIFNLAFRMVHDSENASDVTQNTFIKAYENLGSFDLNLKFFSWLYRIAINESLNALEKQKSSDEISESLPSKDHTPEEAFDIQERNQMMQQALMKLTIEQRSIIVLRHFLDLSYAQMSTTLGIPEKTVKSRLFSARQQLKDLLLQEGF
jgi:RNA polymerase sigma-70 factor (ECF subfamily)